MALELHDIELDDAIPFFTLARRNFLFLAFKFIDNWKYVTLKNLNIYTLSLKNLRLLSSSSKGSPAPIAWAQNSVSFFLVIKF